MTASENHINEKIKIPRNVWAVGFTSFFMDVSSEMVLNILPLFLSNVLGVQTVVIGLIDGVAEATSSLLKMISGWISDKLGSRKWLAVIGYGLSAVVKPFFFVANSWGVVAGIRWMDRVGKGIRTAPRDALVADSVDENNRGFAFGFHRAMDTAGALFGILIAALVVGIMQKRDLTLGLPVFRTIVLISIIPGCLAVFSLVMGAREVRKTGPSREVRISLKYLGRPFTIFLLITGIFTLGNSSDSFLVLRAQNVGMSILGILLMIASFNLIYALISAPAGLLSDRIGRRKLIIGGWLVYAVIYFGFAAAKFSWQIWVLYAVYGLYYGLAYGSANALIADIVPENLRGTAYGTYNAMIGLLAFPASLLAGFLWQQFSPSAPFFAGGALALLAAILMAFWMPRLKIVES